MQPEGLSLRDYFAGQALIGQMSFKRSTVGSETAWAAYKMADAMLARREKDGILRDHEMEALKRRAETAETQAALLVGMRQAARICLNAERERRKALKPGAPATTYTEERIQTLEALLS